MQNSATANPVLSGIFAKYFRDQSGFVAEALAPTFLTGEQSAKYYVFDKGNHLLVPTNIGRAPGARHKEVSMKLSDDNFFCDNYGLKIPVPDEDRKKYANAFDADDAATKRLADIIKVNRELRVRDLVTNAAAVPNAAPANSWNLAVSNPGDDVNAAKEAIRKGVGLRANTMVMSESVRLVLQRHPEIKKMFQLTLNGTLTVEMLKSYFEIQNIIIAGTVLASSAEGDAITADDIWGDEVVLAHVEPGQNLMLPNFARTFNWTTVGSVDGQVETWRDDDRKSTMHQVDHSTDEKLTCSDGGFLITNVLA